MKTKKSMENNVSEPLISKRLIGSRGYWLGIGALLATTSTVSSAGERFIIDGYASHGINVFNNEAIMDYSEVFPGAPMLHEVGFFQPGASDAGVITADISLDTPVATLSSVSYFLGVEDTVDPALFNVTLDQIGSNYLGFQVSTDRQIFSPYDQAAQGSLFIGAGVQSKPTIGEWNKISGKAIVNCDDDGSATVQIGVKNAFANQLYTLWEVGVVNPNTEDQTGYGVPLGGIPNVVVTDQQGCGYKKFDLPYCPQQVCPAGSQTCSAYFSLYHHWDDQVYGGAAGNDFGGLPTGVVGANQIVWPMGGEFLQQPSTTHRGGLRCHAKKRR